MSPFLFALLTSFICLAAPLTTSAQSTVFNYSSTWSGLTSTRATVSKSLLLNGTVFADAYYTTPIPLSGRSFSSFFTFSSNLTTGTGALAFVVVLEPPTSASNEIEVLMATKPNAFGVVFNTSCPSTPDSEGSGWGDQPFGGDPGFGGYRGLNGAGYQITEFAAGSTVTPTLESSVTDWNGPGPWPYFCSSTQEQLQSPDVLLSYHAWIEYNATTKQVTVAITSCDFSTWLPLNISQDLSAVLTKPAYVGLVAENGAIYQISQWNFTNNPTSSVLADLSLASVTASTTSTTSTRTPNSGSSNPGTPSPSGSSKLSKGYVAGFSVLGAGIGVAVVFGVCLLCRRRERKSAKQVHGVGADGAMFETPIKVRPAAAMDVKAVERDTTPLNTGQGGHSAFQVSTTASWLKPATAR